MVKNNATNTNIIVGSGGEINYPLQPAFFARLSGDLTDVTGDGTQYNIPWDTELLDQNADFNTGTGVFTAPVTGLYSFSCAITASGILNTHTLANWRWITSSVQYRGFQGNPFAIIGGGGTTLTMNYSILAYMAAAETMQTQLIVSNGTKVVDVLFGTSTSIQSYFSGALIC
jgi:hypothetical protein